MTNALGTGTVNLCINVPRDERAVLGQAAFARGESVGGFIKRIIGQALESESPEAGARLREIRKQYYGDSFKGVMAIGLLTIFCAALVCGGVNAARRVEEVREEA